MKKVLITGLFTQAGIFAIRRFGKMGYSVTAADTHPLAFGLYSKYVTKKLKLPSLNKNPIGYAKLLLNELEKEQYDYYFPSFEEIYLMSHYKDRIPKCTKTIIPSYDNIIKLHDKGLLRETCKKAGVLYPNTYCPATYNEFLEVAATINYPVFVKMKRSRNSTGLRLVENPENLISAYDDVILRNELKEPDLPLIQRKINGPEVSYSALAFNGQVIGESQHTGIRYIPRSGGTTTCRISLFNKICSEEGAKFIKHINWTGFISIDFMVDKDTGEPYVVDVNPRASVCINVAYYGGVDMIPQWVNIVEGNQVEKLPDILPGVKSSTHFADVMWLLYTYTKGPENWKARKELRKEWWKNRKEIFYDILCKDDWKPRWMLNTFLATQMLKMITSKKEPSALFLQHNVFNEEVFNKQFQAINN